MPDHLPFIRLKGTLGLGVDGRHHVDIRHRIRSALGDGIPKELKDIVFPPAVEPAMRAIPDPFGDHRVLSLIVDIVRESAGIDGMRNAIPRLSGRRKAATTEDHGRQESYYERSRQASNIRIIRVEPFMKVMRLISGIF
jgi:hypothetical protein